MAYDLKRTWSASSLNRQIATGLTISQEGKLLVKIIEDGVEKVMVKAVAAATDIVVGYSKLADAQPDQTSAVEIQTVPTAPASLIVDLRNNNLVSGRLRVVVNSTGAALAIDTTFAGAPADNTVKVDLANGFLKFHADEAGQQITATYLHNLTLAQSKALFGERFINNRGLGAEFGQTEVGAEFGELWTDQFDASLNYAGTTALTLGDDGIITQGGLGPVLNATVIGIPSSTIPFLGVRIRFI
jgi:hypothetical protein